MSRPLALRLTVAMAVAGCFAASAVPALAATDETQVSYVVADGTRQFNVTEVDGTTPLANFTFDNNLQKPFRTIVNDNNRLLNSAGYQVNAQLTNLYLNENGSYSYSTFIPSKNLSLTYGLNPLTGTSSLPVIPKIGLDGVVGTCEDPAVQGALDIVLDPITGLLNLSLLSPLLQTVCTELAGLTVLDRTVLDATVNAATRTVTTALALPDLPFSLTGAQQAGAFTNPSYQGAIATNDTAKTGAPAATSKRIMTGTSLLATGGDVTGLLSSLTTQLGTDLASTTLITGDNTGVTTVQNALAALSSTNAALVTTISKLDTQDELDLIALLSPVLLPVDVNALTTVTGQYDAFPVLTALRAGTKQGTYDGTLIVDFFETS